MKRSAGGSLHDYRENTEAVLKVIIAPIYLALGLRYVLGNGTAALSSVIANLMGSFFIAGAAAGWLAHGNEQMI